MLYVIEQLKAPGDPDAPQAPLPKARMPGKSEASVTEGLRLLVHGVPRTSPADLSSVSVHPVVSYLDS